MLKLGLHFVSPCGWRGRRAGTGCGSEALRKWFFHSPEHIFPFAIQVFPSIQASQRCSSRLRAPPQFSRCTSQFSLIHFSPEILDWAVAGVGVGGWHPGQHSPKRAGARAARGRLRWAVSIFALQWIASHISLHPGLCCRELLSCFSEQKKKISWLQVWNVAAPPG